jgi:hypothetical protein
MVEKIRTELAPGLVKELDTDPDILAAFAKRGIESTPSDFYEAHTGIFVSDVAIAAIQRCVENPIVGRRLINAPWHLMRLGSADESLVLSDRPLVRLYGLDHPKGTWFLPLTPKCAFVATMHDETMKLFRRVTPGKVARTLNVVSANQSQRFVFSTERRHEHWLAKHLRRRAPT